MGRPSRHIDTDIAAFLQRPGFKILDLCCCSGVGVENLIRKGYNVLGVDIKKPSFYPGTFLQADATQLDLTFVKLFNFVTGSPPCQKFSRGTYVAQRNGKTYPDLLAPIRDLITASGIPGVMENIPESGIRPDFMLCGSMFGLPQTRHRHFEAINWKPVYKRLYCDHTINKGKCHVLAGAFKGTIHDAAISMGCYSTRLRSEIKEGFPPAYLDFIMNVFFATLPALNNQPGFSHLPGSLTTNQALNNSPVISHLPGPLTSLDILNNTLDL